MIGRPQETDIRELAYSASVTSQGDLNRMIAAHSYVSDVLIGDTRHDPTHDERLRKDWRESLYQRVCIEEEELEIGSS